MPLNIQEVIENTANESPTGIKISVGGLQLRVPNALGLGENHWLLQVACAHGAYLFDIRARHFVLQPFAAESRQVYDGCQSNPAAGYVLSGKRYTTWE